ncbi:hypothetical protein QBC47DRAFT_296547, partial [Echria macrotheca]
MSSTGNGSANSIRKEKQPARAVISGAVEKPRRGPKPKTLAEKAKEWTWDKPKVRQERSYSREQKIEVIMFLLRHRIEDNRPWGAPRRRNGQSDGYLFEEREKEDGTVVLMRAPTYAEASKWWQIPQATICSWWDKREKILEGTGIELPGTG